MKDGDRITYHLNAFNALLNHVKAISGKAKDNQSLLCCLSDCWENLIVAISRSIMVENLKLDEIVGQLQ